MKQWEKELYAADLGELMGLKAERIDEAAVLERTLRKLRLPKAPEREDPEPAEEDLPSRPGSAWGFGLAISAAFLVILLFAVNAFVPEITENLPVLGGFFQVINGGNRNPSPLPPESVPTPEPTPTASPRPESQNPAEDLSVSAAVTYLKVHDGKVTMDLQLHIFSTSGEPLSLNGEPKFRLPYQYRAKTKDGIGTDWNALRTNDEIFPTDRAAAPGEESSSVYDFKNLTLSFYPGEGYSRENKTLLILPVVVELETAGSPPRKRTLSTELEVRVTEGEEVTQNGVTMAPPALISSPGTEQRLMLFWSCEEKIQAEVRELETGNKLYSMGGWSLEDDTDNVVISMYPADEGGKPLAEFTADLETLTVTPSEHYKNPSSLLFYDEELLGQDIWAFPYYRAEDWELENLQGGLKVEYFSICPCFQTGCNVLITFAADREPDLENVTVSAEPVAELGAVGFGSGGALSPDDVFPLSAFSPEPYLHTADSLQKSEEVHGPKGLADKRFYYGWKKRELQRQGLTLLCAAGQTPGLYKPNGPAAGQVWRITVRDCANGNAVLLEEDITLRLPEDVPLPEGTRLRRICDSDWYPYVPVPEDYLPEN